MGKGRPVVLYDLTAVCRWEVLPVDDKMGVTRGKFWIKNFTSEDGAEAGPTDAEIELDVKIDTSKGRCLSQAVREKGIPFMRTILKRFLDAIVSTAVVPGA